MILTDREIQIAIQTQQIILKPAPKPDLFSSTSVDLTLAPRIRLWRASTAPAGVEETLTISPSEPGFSFNDIVKQYSDPRDIPAEGYVIKPGDFLLGWTAEDLSIPHTSRIAARVEGKSSLARLGVGVHITAPTIHAGFKGPIQLEIKHHGTVAVRLKPGMKICQLIFEQTLGTPNSGYGGVFLGQAPN